MTPEHYPEDHLYPWKSAHQADIEAHFGENLFRPLTSEERQFLSQLDVFLVAFTNRCGSNLLCSLLNNAGLGVPEASEPLNRTTLIPLAKEHRVASLTDYLLGYLRGWQRDGITGLKVGPQQLFWLKRTGLLAPCRRVVVIDAIRSDRLDQAISHYLARASGQWHSNMAVEKRVVKYSSLEILRSLEDIGRGRELIERYLAIHQCPSLKVNYEDVQARPAEAVSAIADFLGATLPALATKQEPALKKQGGELNRDFRQRFLTEFGGR